MDEIVRQERLASYIPSRIAAALCRRTSNVFLASVLWLFTSNCIDVCCTTAGFFAVDHSAGGHSPRVCGSKQFAFLESEAGGLRKPDCRFSREGSGRARRIHVVGPAPRLL